MAGQHRYVCSAFVTDYRFMTLTPNYMIILLRLQSTVYSITAHGTQAYKEVSIMFNFVTDSISSGLSTISGFDQNQSSLPHWYFVLGSGYVLVVSS